MNTILLDLKRMFNMTAFATFVVGLLIIADAPASESLPVSTNDQYTEVVSGKYWMMPRSAWLEEGLVPAKYVQVHWYLEATELKKISKEEYDTPVRKYDLWEEVRKEMLEAFVNEGLLTKRKGKSMSFPAEIYDDREWSRTIKQAFAYRHGYSVNFCKARVVVRALKDKNSVSGDLKWWDEKVINLSNRDCGA
jgi:hypothetical protein